MVGKQQFRIQKLPVDAGHMANLIPLSVLDIMKVQLEKTEGLVIRTATIAMLLIDWYADLDVLVAGITTPLRVYTMLRKYTPSYVLLLGRNWLQAVHATGDYGN
ncbi:hypothetical protein L873DRAFT_1796469 [Choiromyces venosus 120613-1]|uniref:Uncharacterized protein n=1 Tax=Choiromyces venosus 120613-1 TaxID=1336337 RepID=A0A3N4IRI9_9PEZI|nr:hypothetical protein L873DRAFT_1796469 [Choiromyces venosus 120613-1]